MRQRGHQGVVSVGGLLVALVLLPACPKPPSAVEEAPPVAVPEAPSAEEAFAIATDAYVYGYPLVTMEMTRRAFTDVAAPSGTDAPMGQFAHLRAFPDASFRGVTAPNADTLYSTAWLDLAEGPWVLSLPNMRDRYFLMPMLSAWTEVFASPGTRTTGTVAQDILVSGPGWRGDVPVGMSHVEAPTDTVWILGRTWCAGTPEDLAEVHAVQDQYRLVPLAAWGQPYTPSPATPGPAADTTTNVRDQVNAMEGKDFFALLAERMGDDPPARDDAPIVERMARIGIVPGKPLDVAALHPDVQRALETAPEAARARILAEKDNVSREANGWTVMTGTGRYGTDYLRRAYVAWVGLGANVPQDAVYPMTTVDADGAALDGANTYVLHFAKGDLPPVRGFWSLTMYDSEYFFTDAARHSIGAHDDPVLNPDGSLDLYVQATSPGKRREANWLQAPAGDFALMLRLYWPDASVIDGTWAPPPVRRVSGPS